MKNKKVLLIAAASVLAAGIATAGVASFAWYTATQSAALTGVNATYGSITTEASTITSGTYYVRVEFSNVTASVALSDTEGETFGVVNNKLAAATGTTEGSFVLTPKAYYEEACTNEMSVTDIKSLLDASKTYNVTLTPTARVRVGLTTGATYAAGAGTALSTGITVSVDATNGVLKINDAATLTAYFSISGSAVDGDAEAGDAATPEALASVTGSITSSLAVNS